MAIAGDAAIAGGSLGVVNLRFQANNGPAVEWKVNRLRLSESLFEPYLAVVDLVVADLSVDPMLLVGLSCDLEMERDAHVRRLCGMVARVHYLGALGGHQLARIDVVPAFHFLDQRVNTRMFQEKSVPDILKAVLEEALGPYRREVRLRLRGQYDPREYCLQYGESDRTFVERLMQEEGIFYFFEHAEDAKEVMVLVDANAECNPCELAVSGPVQILNTDGESTDVEAVRDLTWVGEARTTSIALRDYDWTRPALLVEGKATAAGAQGPDREVYLYGASGATGGYSGDKYTRMTARGQANVLGQAETVRTRRGTGSGYVTAFLPGTTVELTGHAVEERDSKYLLVRVDHRAQSPDGFGYEHSERGDRDPGYVNSFECVAANVPFRSPRTIPRPRVGGLQNAKVVGPAGEEIHTDSHGRIKVQFPWDRQAKGDDKSSCWVRVAQGWAGPGWGSLFIPRVGMEVLVAFIEGDLDRPIVVGCVFNGQNPPPYPLPAEKTKSTIKTWSSPGGEGYNEIRFEDKKDNEELYLQAQKDLGIFVKHDEQILIKNDKDQIVEGKETLLVKKDRERTVEGNQALTVRLDDSSTIDGNQSLAVNKNRDTMVLGKHDETVALSQSTSVGLARSLSVGGSMDVTVSGSSSENVVGSRSEDVGKSYTLTVGKESDIKIGDKLTVEVTKDITITGKATFKQTIEKEMSLSADKIQIVAKKELSIKVGDASIVLKKNGDIVIKGGKVSVEASGNLKLKGSKVADN